MSILKFHIELDVPNHKRTSTFNDLIVRQEQLKCVVYLIILGKTKYCGISKYLFYEYLMFIIYKQSILFINISQQYNDILINTAKNILKDN